MTRLLVSVRDAAEAQATIAAGAHLVDIKEPSRGALGTADAATMRAVLATVGGFCPVSAALGELAAVAPRRLRALPAGIRYAKLGLSQCATRDDWTVTWTLAIRALPAGTSAVAVAYADHGAARSPLPSEVLDTGLRLGCRVLLVDTFDKRQGRLFDHLTTQAIEQLVTRARDSGMLTVLAGSLGDDSLERAAELAPDYVAVRGAVCRGGRHGSLDAARVRQYVERLGKQGPSP